MPEKKTIGHRTYGGFHKEFQRWMVEKIIMDNQPSYFKSTIDPKKWIIISITGGTPIAGWFIIENPRY